MLKESVIVITAFAVGAACGYYTLPSKVVEKVVYQEAKTEHKTQDKDVVKKENKIIRKKETTLPDGTKTVETEIVDKDQTSISNDSTTDTNHTISQTTEKETTYTKNSYFISPGVKYSLEDSSLTYGLFLEKKLIGPIYIGGFGFLDKSFGLTVGLGF